MRKVFVPILLALLMFFVISPAHAQNKDDIQKKIQEYEKKLQDVRQQKDTLSSQIRLMDTQIYLTELKAQETEEKISTTEKEVNVLGTRIEGLDSSLNQLSETLLNFVIDGYKQRHVSVFDILLDSENATDLMSKVKYYSAARRHNEKILLQVQETKFNFEEQKNLREKKITELDTLKETLVAQQADIENQQVAKRELLEVTQNDEKNYQVLLEKAKAEYAAIQGIIAGAGTETLLREVKKGDSIASIISGASCNSSGTHLHFIVQEGSTVKDPFGYLKSVDHTNDSNGDAFNPSGSWDWPIPPTIHLHQGYGATWFARTYGWYSTHNGIDITGGSSTVGAVADGTLYRGSYSGFNGCALPYVKVTHKDSNLTTLYLHVYSM